jgi:endoglucanase
LPSGALTATNAGYVTRLAIFPDSVTPAETDEWRNGTPFLAGLNLAGLEFGTDVPGGRDKPGGYFAGQEEQVPFFSAKGFNAFRIPVLWERLQPELDGGFDKSYLGYVQAVVDAVDKAGGYAIIDCHNYMRRTVRGRPRVIGEDTLVTARRFAEFWAVLAAAYRRRPRVTFSLMNEPYNVDLEIMVSTFNLTIEAIRRQGAGNLILLSGTHFSGAHAWRSSGSADAFASVVDSADNLAFDVHQYLDADHSGRDPQCVPGKGSVALQAFTEWARENGARGFLGEFAGGPNSQCLSELSSLLSYVAANRDVWIGWSYWAAGRGWASDDPFAVSAEAVGKPQMAVLSRFAAGEK